MPQLTSSLATARVVSLLGAVDRATAQLPTPVVVLQASLFLSATVSSQRGASSNA